MNRSRLSTMAVPVALAIALAMAGIGCGSASTTAAPTTTEVTTTTSPAAMTADDFVIEYPCGYSFQVGSEDQTLLLIVRRGTTAGGPTTWLDDLPVELPSENWTAAVEVGENLAANWCDDAMEPDEPVRRVDATFPVRGHLDVVEAGDGARSATITATDLVVDPLDGPPILLGDIQITNSHFGVIAG